MLKFTIDIKFGYPNVIFIYLLFIYLFISEWLSEWVS